MMAMVPPKEAPSAKPNATPTAVANTPNAIFPTDTTPPPQICAKGTINANCGQLLGKTLAALSSGVGLTIAEMMRLGMKVP